VGVVAQGFAAAQHDERLFFRWNYDGTLDRIHHALYVQCREMAGRESSPTAAIIDSQSVKSAEKGGTRLTRLASMRAKRSKARSAKSL
jgi:transposase